MKNGMKWYCCNLFKFFGGVQGLWLCELVIYIVVFDLIYMYGGLINNDFKWIFGWILDVGLVVCRCVIDELFECDLLELDGDKFINQWVCKMVLLDDEWFDEIDDLDDIIVRKFGEKLLKIKMILVENE